MAAVALLAVQVARAGSLDADIDRILSDKALAKAHVGVAVAKLGSTVGQPQFVYRHNSTDPLTPASNLKVVTTSAALARLGPAFKYRTTLALHGTELVLVGDGDPTLGDPELLAGTEWQVDTVFAKWAEELKAKGITSLSSVSIDDSVFDQNFVHPSWPANQRDQPYLAGVSGLAFSFNCLKIVAKAGTSGVTLSSTPATRYVSLVNKVAVGKKDAIGVIRPESTNEMTVAGEVRRGVDQAVTVPVYDPALYCGTVLAETLARNGITVSDPVVKRRPGVRISRPGQSAYALAQGWTAVSVYETPLTTVLGRCNKDSANLYAESLCKRLGALATGTSGSWTNGTAAVAAWVHSLGVPTDQLSLDDGCGLSKNNRISAEAMVKILAADYASAPAARDAFVSSLSIGGVDGTLTKRFRDNLKGRVFAKTGFINSVSTLSGLVKTQSGDVYAFSILINGVPGGVKPLQDKIVTAIDASTK